MITKDMLILLSLKKIIDVEDSRTLLNIDRAIDMLNVLENIPEDQEDYGEIWDRFYGEFQNRLNMIKMVCEY